MTTVNAKLPATSKKAILLNLAQNLEQHLTRCDAQEGSLFRGNVLDIVNISSVGYDILLEGPSPSALLMALRSSVEIVADHREQGGEIIWNPIVAMLFNTIADLVKSPVTLEDVNHSLSVLSLDESKNAGRAVAVKTAKAKKGAVNSPSKASSKPIHTVAAPVITVNAGQSYADILATPGRYVKVNGVRSEPVACTSRAIPATTRTTAIPAMAKVAPVTKVHAERATFDLLQRELNSGAFRLKNTSKIRCSTRGCTVCIKFCKENLQPTKCSEVKCHHKGVVCHPSGWYYHVFPKAWNYLQSLHLDESVSVTSDVSSMSTVSGASVKKRRLDWATEVDLAVRNGDL